MIKSRKQKSAWVISLFAAIGLSFGVYKYIQLLKQYDKGINEPIEEGLAFERIKFNTTDGLILHRPNGTHIEIPPNAIVDENGRWTWSGSVNGLGEHTLQLNALTPFGEVVGEGDLIIFELE